MKETANEWRPFVFLHKRQTDGLTELNLKLAGGLPFSETRHCETDKRRRPGSGG